MKRIAIAVIAALFPICSAYADNGLYYEAFVDCSPPYHSSFRSCIERYDGVPEGSTISFTFEKGTEIAPFIARHCKLDTVTILHDEEFRDVARYTLVCEKVKPREEKITTL